MAHLGKRALVFAFLPGCLAIAQNTPAPRATASAYPASTAQPVYSIGAKQLSRTEVQNSFATPLTGKYVVVEIGFYPADSKTITLRQSDFALRSPDGKDVVSPVSPATIAAINQKRPPSSTDVSLYPSANVGYVSYPDPNTGRRASGPVVGGGMGVGVDKTPAAGSSDADRQTMEAELRDKELKDADVSKPVAGYLYFPVTARQKGDYHLDYTGAIGATSLQLKTH